MNGPDSNPVLSTLLAEASWIEALAERLVRDEATARDVVQTTWLEAIERPPRAGERSRPAGR